MIGTSRKSLLVPIIMIRVIRKSPEISGISGISGKSGKSGKSGISGKKLLLSDTNCDAVLVVLAERLHA